MNLDETRYLRELRALMDQHFSLDEIQILCFDLGVDYEHLAGSTKPLRIQALIVFLAQRARLDDLLTLVQAERPRVTWPAIPSAKSQIRDGQALQLVRFREPLLRAVFDFQGRLYNIVEGFFLKIYYFNSDHDREYAVKSTLFNLGEYLGWVEIMRREGQYLDLGDVVSNRGVEDLLRAIAHDFARDDIDPVLRLFRAEQRAIGEIMITDGNDASHKPLRCMGYAAFADAMERPRFSRWFQRLQDDVELLAEEHKQHETRLIKLQHGLVELIEFLDPQKEYVSDKYRDKIKTPFGDK